MSGEELYGHSEDPTTDKGARFGYHQVANSSGTFDQDAYNREFINGKGSTNDPNGWGQQGYAYDENGKAIDGTTGAQQDANYYRQQGQQTMTPVQLSDRAANFSEAQVGSLAALRDAALGNAPSQAVAQGNIAQSDALRANTLALGQGGTGAGLAAMRGGGLTMGSLAAQTMNGRAGEMAANMGQYGAGAGAMRGQADQASIAQAQLDAQQRALQQQRQQAYEKMAWDTTNAQMQAANEARTNQQNQYLTLRRQRDAEKQADLDRVKDTASMALGLGTSLARSDERAKECIYPMGSLGRLVRR